MKIHIYWDVTTWRDNPDNMDLQQPRVWCTTNSSSTSCCGFSLSSSCRSFQICCWTHPQCNPPPVVQTSITDKYYLLLELAWVFRKDSNSKILLFQQLLFLVIHVLLSFPAVLTVFKLLLSSFTIFLTVLNFITSSSLLQSVLLHFCHAQITRLSFRIICLHFSHFSIVSRSSRTFPIPVTVRNPLLFTVSWQFSFFCIH